ncbi:hypothetical protein HK405_008322, partial [Cladochytrium tenue]
MSAEAAPCILKPIFLHASTTEMPPPSPCSPQPSAPPTATPHPAAAVASVAAQRWQPRRLFRKAACEHGRRKTQCVACYDAGTGGGSVCAHRRRKDACKDCRLRRALAVARIELAARTRNAWCDGSGGGDGREEEQLVANVLYTATEAAMRGGDKAACDDGRYF